MEQKQEEKQEHAALKLSDLVAEIFECLVNTSKFSSIIDNGPGNDNAAGSDSNTAGYKDLLHCILVNRLWCRTGVPILWRQPFQPVNERGYKAILVYIKCMDKRERKPLERRGYDMRQFLTSKKPTLFQYPAFLIGLNYRWFLNSVEMWCYKTPVKPQSGTLRCLKKAKSGRQAETEEVVFVVKEILQLCVNRHSALKRLCVSSIPRTVTDPKKYLLWSDEQFAGLFGPTKELAVSGQFTGQAADIVTLSQTCQTLERLVIYTNNMSTNDLDDDAREIGTSFKKLIETQRALREFCIVDGRGFMKFVDSALPSQKETLNYVRFHKTNFRGCGPWTGLAECTNLQKLAFFNCENVNQKNVTPMFNANFSHLKKLDAVYPQGRQHGNDEHLASWVSTMKF